ncbi:phage portal protein [Rhizorhabdus histidinilytica]|uniref:phage portal protein n=1 Tax=Rhizorhabdus histidinilytica TaxID=439228 RepID=UPI00321FAD5F
MLTRLDRAIASVSPRWAVRRALDRVRLSQLERTAPRSGRRYSDAGANFDINTGNPDDARSRRLVNRETVLRLACENPHGKKALNALVNNAVGWGITGSPKGPKALAALWKEWTRVSDFRGRLDLFGQQELAVRTMFREGEVFIVRRFVKNDQSGVPLRLQLLDGGMLATSKVGDDIEDGIEYDADGNPVAYWFHQARPDYRRNRPPVRFAAGDVIHLFIQEEVGQKRGRSVYEPVIKRLGDVDDALDADLVRRKIESCFVGFRTLPVDETGDPPIGIGREDRGEGLAPSEYFEAGSIVTLPMGEDIKFGDPKPLGGLGDAVKINLLAAAAGIGVTYEHMTGDLSNVNFSSYRAGALEFDATIERIQWNTIIPVGLNRVWDWFCAAAYEFGRTSKRSYEMRWTPPPRKSIDRKGDAEADILEMQAGLENRRNLLNSRGIEHDTFVEETAADLRVQQEKGLFFKGDPFTAAQAAGTTPDIGSTK